MAPSDVVRREVTLDLSPPAGTIAIAAAGKAWLLQGLGFATGAEFYVNDSMNLVLPDIAGTLGASHGLSRTCRLCWRP
jgi:hypothetical protein